MFNIVFIILAIVLFGKLSRVNKSIKDIKEELTELKSGRTNFSQQSAVTPQSSENPLSQPISNNSSLYNIVPPVDTLVKPPKTESDLMVWFKENPLLKIGILMILVGFGWFVSYAFTHNWIGPAGRVTLGVFIGTIVTLFGTWRLRKNEVQGNALTILGTALIIISILAGDYYYHFFGSYVVLGVIFIVSLYTSFSAVAYSTEKLAVYGMFISLLAPFLSHTSSTDPVLLYLYLGIVSLTAIWISIARNWRSINLIGITGILIYSLPDIMSNSAVFNISKYFILFTVYGISLLYLCVGVWSLIQNKIKAETGDVYLAIVNTLILLGFTVTIVPEIYQSLTIALWMLIYAFSGFFVFTRTRNEKLFYIHALLSVLLLAIATSIELSGPTLVIAFAIESAIVIIASFIVTGNIRIAESFSIVLAVPFFMSLQSLMSNKWGSGILHSDFTVLALMAIILAGLGFFYKIHKVPESVNSRLNYIMFIVSSFYVYSLIWLSSHALMSNDDSAVFVSLLIFTIIGLGSHFYGLFNRNDILKKYGMAILILVVARLVLVDVWKMELVLRVITFIVLGIMFMSTAFISKSQKTEANLIQK